MATLTPCRVSTLDRVSLLNITELSEHSVSNHPMNSSVPFSSLLYSGTQHLPVGIMASPLASRLAYPSGRIEFVSYGLLFHFQLLSTPHYCDAVTFCYRPRNFGRAGLSPASSVCSKAHWQVRSSDLRAKTSRNQCTPKVLNSGCRGKSCYSTPVTRNSTIRGGE
jgi:hypothetical protein